MRTASYLTLLLAFVSFSAFIPRNSLADDPPSDGAKSAAASPGAIAFSRDVQPILARHCLECHGPDKQKGGLRLDSRAAALKGGDSGPAIVPSKSAESRLIQLVAGEDPDSRMPPKGDLLSSAEVALLRAWIDQGIDWSGAADAPSARSSHWSLQPVQRPPPPPLPPGVKMADVQNPIDHFILQRLSQAGLKLAPPADRLTLIRRLSYDLTGLPPDPRAIQAFLADASPRAYEDLVDRLLASPQYGERWGRHWLDLARYTESQGFEYDKLRDHAWHYRDYVIKSFNEDKPYDQFMKEQIAGDALEPVTADGIVATSFLICGPWDEAGNAQANATQKAITREDELEDTISVIGQTFLGLTLNCARCHSHKFDPIPQEEYYRIKAVFEGVKHGERPLAAPARIKERQDAIAELNRQIEAAQQQIAALESEGWRAAAAKTRTNSSPPGPSPFALWNFEAIPSGALPGELKGGAGIAQGRLNLPREGAFFQTAPLSQDIREKTLEAWVALANLEQRGGAAISIESEDGRVFDAIVFGERQAKKWMAGSSGFERTRDLNAPEETSPPGSLIHVAIVYAPDNSIAVYRNGEPYGSPYTPGSGLQTFKAGNARVLLGLRHTGGGRPWLTGQIKQAALYNRALTASEVAASYKAAGWSIPREEALASLSNAQKQAHEQALAKIQNLRQTLDAVKPFPVSYTGVRVQPSPTRRLRRGDVTLPEEVVTPAALGAIVDVNADFGLPADAPEGLRRLRFAEWLANPRNPLPARVMVNRLWHFHFGQGFLSTPNDLGMSGARPTHPELLDWLAMEFIERAWSVKALHRLIVGSATYRQSSTPPALPASGAPRVNPLEVDADNQWLWRFPPRRLEGESVRDAMLAVSGQLNLTVGGPSFRPFDALKFPANAYVPADKIGPEFNRRTVYRMNVNSGKEPLLDAFDCPDPSVKTPRRGVTTTPLQALGLMNNSFVLRQAEHLAARSLRESGNDPRKAVESAYWRALGRSPRPDEIERAVAAAGSRGLASVCWALLNSTEFVYVR